MRGTWFLLAATIAPVALAQQPASLDASQWLQKVYTASKKLSFSGTFIYQHGPFMETSRISRAVAGCFRHNAFMICHSASVSFIRLPLLQS